jgi:hypothetical protein
MFAEIIICMNKRQSTACCAFMVAVSLLTRNFFHADIKIRGDIGVMTALILLQLVLFRKICTV